MVRILGLQRTHQQFKARIAAQVLQAEVAAEEGPAGKAGIHAAFQPLEGQVAAANQGMDAGNLVMSVVGVAEGPGILAGPAHALQCLRVFA